MADNAAIQPAKATLRTVLSESPEVLAVEALRPGGAAKDDVDTIPGPQSQAALLVGPLATQHKSSRNTSTEGPCNTSLRGPRAYDPEPASQGRVATQVQLRKLLQILASMKASSDDRVGSEV